MSLLTNDGALDGANDGEVQALWERVTRFERCDAAILGVAFDLAGASETVRAAIQSLCQSAQREYDASFDANRLDE
jgi:hypothetical protein